MSDLNDLIHTNATRAYYTGKTQGALEERERIIKLLTNRSEDGESWLDLFEGCTCCQKLDQEGLIALIKGEQK